jgi:hypothetical protein
VVDNCNRVSNHGYDFQSSAQHFITIITYIYVATNEKMSHPGQRKRLASDEDDIELTGTQLEMSGDDDIEPDHRFREDAGLLRNVRIQKRSCIHNTCRIVMGIVATAVFTFMLIQLWANYGDTIKQRVFSPQVVGAGRFHKDGAQGKLFGMEFHKWVNNTLYINMTKPEHDLLQISFQTPQTFAYEWDQSCLKVSLDSIDDMSVVVWSI